ncbi:MAG: SRPBCC family protein [Williamsia sp.]|nr:SRPBCC family protein [Williamsia sp.]
MQQTSTGAVDTGIHSYGGSTVNVSDKGRGISVLLGSYFLSRGLKKRSIVKTLLGSYLLYRGASGHCAVTSAIERSRYTDKAESVNIKTTFIVNRPRQEVYDFWRKLENLPLFMKHLTNVSQYNDTQSHWEAQFSGATLKWDAEIVKEEDGSLLGWRSLPGSTIENAGKVSFRDALGHQGTELNVVITYRPPAGRVGSGVATLLNPIIRKMIETDISNFKQYIETGRIAETT